MRGYSNVEFGVNDEITVEQAAVIIARYADFLGIYEEADYALEGYADASSVSDWAWDAVNWAVANEIYVVPGDALMPQAPAKRWLVADMLYHFGIKEDSAE